MGFAHCHNPFQFRDLFHRRLFFVQFVLRIHWCGSGQRNRFATISFAHHHAFGTGGLHRVFYRHQQSARNRCHRIFDGAAHIAHRNADANSVWRALVANRSFHHDTFCNLLFRGLVRFQNIPSGNIDVWQKTNLERIV